MKMNSKKIIIAFITLGLFFFAIPSHAQEEADTTVVASYEPGLSFEFLKKGDGTRLLSAKMTAKKEKFFLPVENATIHFYAGDEKELKLGSAKTDKYGKALFEIKPEFTVPLNDTGLVKYTAEYEAEQNSEAASEELTVLDMSIQMTLEIIDSVKTVSLKATRFGKGKEIIPLGDMEINIYVKRLHSDLKVGSVFLDPESGEGSMEFPLIPGDSIGNVTVISRVDNSEIFGSVENRAVIQWGTPVVYETSRIGPALWSQNAPIWMTITLYIFLVGVWYHLIIVFRRMYKIKKLGEEARKEPGFK
jgi:hypothetical protein